MRAPDYTEENIYPEDSNLHIFFVSHEYLNYHQTYLMGRELLGWAMTGDSLSIRTIDEGELNWDEEKDEPIDGVSFYAYRAIDHKEYSNLAKEILETKHLVTEVVFPNQSIGDTTQPHNLIIGDARWNDNWDSSDSLILGTDYEAIICAAFVDQEVDAKEVTIIFFEEGDISYHPQSEKNEN